MLKIAHIINPVNAKKGSELAVAQPITFETMRRAAETAVSSPSPSTTIHLFAIAYPEDAPTMPAGFTHLPPLTQSVLDVGHFAPPRKLPLLRHILDALYAASDADFFIYTNVDIALLPQFYTAVSQIIAAGHDAFVINRRTIPKTHTRVADIPHMLAEPGEPHRGWDCFVFRRQAYEQYQLGDVCLGAPRVGLALLANLIAFADNFKEFKDEHLTFHLGDDRSWRSWRPSDYERHNTRELMKILARLEQANGAFPVQAPPGAFLAKKRTLGPFYELWTRLAHLPIGWSRWLNGWIGNR